MSDVARVLEDVRRQVTSEPGAFDRLVRRRRRRRAGRRVATVAIALAVSIIAIGGAVRIFEAERQLPADRIDRGTIRHLRSSWTADIGGLAIGHEVGGHHEHDVVTEPFAPVALGDDIIVMTGDGRLVAFPQECRSGSCSPSWTARVRDPAFAPIAASGSVVVISKDGAIHSFSGCRGTASRCRPAWTGRLPGDGTGPAGPPVSANGFVYGVTTSGSVFAFDAGCGSAESCDPAWTVNIGAGDVDHLTQPVADGGLVFATNDLDRVYAIDAFTGEVLWNASIDRPEGGWPLPDTLAVSGRFVFATFSNALYAFPVDCSSSCEPAWHAQAPSPDAIMSSPVADGGLVFVKSWSTGRTGHVLAFSSDCATGGRECEPTWTAVDHGWGDVVAADGVVYSTSYLTGSVTAYPELCRPDVLGCAPIWQAVELGTPLSGPTFPFVRNGLLFVPTETGELHALPEACTSSCRPVRIFAPALVGRQRVRSLSPPLIRNGNMWFVSADGHVFAYSIR